MADQEPLPYRLSDGERDEALTQLRTAFQEGRLTTDEHEERSSAALRAVTDRDLAPLFTDLPVHLRPAALGRAGSAASPVVRREGKADRRPAEEAEKKGPGLAGLAGFAGFLLFVWGIPTFVSGNVVAISVFLGFFSLMVVPGIVSALRGRRRGGGEITKG
ncbi:DUF1707 SHOCT-like domain-containing protein [Nocardiopsis algeriensis]|uniref:DUF1707 SHOCT-like domain-containing protein n=1 Tax=Nocardiopsis algeriensis TaxID=1478215 RepID=UPI003B435C4D